MDKVECAYDCWYGGFILNKGEAEPKKGQAVKLDGYDSIPGANTVGLWDALTYSLKNISDAAKPIGILTHDSTIRFQTPLSVTGEAPAKIGYRELTKAFITGNTEKYSDLTIGEFCYIKFVLPEQEFYRDPIDFTNFFYEIAFILENGFLPDIAVGKDGLLSDKKSTNEFLRELFASKGNYQFKLLDPWYRGIGMPPVGWKK